MSDRYWAHGAFGGVVVQFQDAMIEVWPEPRHAHQGIADCFCKGRFAGDAGQLSVQPCFQIVKDRFSLDLPNLAALSWC